MNYTEAQIESYLDGIYSGTITEENLPKSLYKAIGEYFDNAVIKGFGVATGTVDEELLTALRENVWLFSAAKTYQQTKDISSLLIDDNGKVRSKSEFNRVAMQRYNNWNKVYGETEYITCIGQAQTANKWTEIERNADILPILQYHCNKTRDSADICIAMDGTTAPKDAAIWKTHSPLNHFRCQCYLTQHEKGEEKLYTPKNLPELNATFANNPGMTGTVFNKEHPYFTEAPKALAKRNFDLEIPKL